MVIQVLMAVAVVVIALPALVLGATRLTRRGQRTVRASGGSRSEFVVILTGRALGLLLILALSALVLVATIGALIRDLELPSLVYVFFVLDLLLAALVVLTSGGPRGTPVRRRGTPARR